LVTEGGGNLIAVEIKSGSTIQPDFLKNISWFEKITNGTPMISHIIYGGHEEQNRTTTRISPWNKLPDI